MSDPTPSPIRTAQALGIGGSLFLSGFISSFSLIVIPTLLSTSPPSALLSQWHTQYNLGKARAPPAAILAGAAYAYAAYRQRAAGQDWRGSVAAGFFTMSIVLFTRVVMWGNVVTLVDAAGGVGKQLSDQQVRALVAKWRDLNYLRAMLPLVGGLIGYWNFW